MIEGTITLKSTASGKLYGRILWEAESNGTAANTSTVTAKIQLHRQSGYTTTGTWKGSLTVGGTTANISYYGSIGSSWVTVKTLTATVAHNADGSGTCYIYGKVSGPGGTSMEGVSVSGSETVALEKIARYATITAVSAFTDEGNPVLSYSNPAGEAVESLAAALSVDGESIVAAYRSLSKTGTSYTFSLTDAERNSLRSASAKSNALTVYVLLRSVIGGVASVAKTTVTMTIVNAHPTVNPSIVDTNSKTVALTGDSKILVSLHSVAKITVNAAARKGASISSVRVEHGTAVLTGDGTLNVTNNPIKITVTDSRGNAVTYTATNIVIPYIDPTAAIENSMPNAAGEMDLAATGKIFDGSFGRTENAFSVKYRFKEGYGSYGDWIIFDSATIDGFDYVAEAAITGLDYQKAYTFQVAVYDSLHPDGVLSAERKFVAKPIADWSDTDWNFNVPVSMSGNVITGLCDAPDETGAVSVSFGRRIFAPSGYGLGETAGQLCKDVDSAIKIGFYYTTTSTQNLPDITGMKYATMLVERRYGYIYHTLISADGFSGITKIMRSSKDGGETWEDWEWENPPMIPGTEYRTTARVNEKAVYKKADSDGHILCRLDGESDWKYETTHTVMLWENDDPAATFAAQTVSLDLSNYDGISILYRNQTDGEYHLNTGHIPKDTQGVLWYGYQSGNHVHRGFTANANGVTFNACQYSGGSNDNKFCIPLIIYGVKGIQ